jgi:uncharacterized membrane-anchored protein
MATYARPDVDGTGARLWNKVPEVTVWFWIIKVLATTVGETAADYLAEDLGFGLTNTTFLMAAVLAVLLVAQFRTRQYTPFVYWPVVVVISIVGTLFSDKLVDEMGVSTVTTTALFGAALAATFVIWWRYEHTLSIHSITSFRREAFYWLAILCTFSLGTAAGDLVSERMDLGYLTAAFVFAGVIALVAVARFVFHAGAVLTFWIAYILTRPLGASLGDYTSQSEGHGGLGWGATNTSFVFLALILAVVTYLAVRKPDLVDAHRASA